MLQQNLLSFRWGAAIFGGLKPLTSLSALFPLNGSVTWVTLSVCMSCHCCSKVSCTLYIIIHEDRTYLEYSNLRAGLTGLKPQNLLVLIVRRNTVEKSWRRIITVISCTSPLTAIDNRTRGLKRRFQRPDETIGVRTPLRGILFCAWVRVNFRYYAAPMSGKL